MDSCKEELSQQSKQKKHPTRWSNVMKSVAYGPAASSRVFGLRCDKEAVDVEGGEKKRKVMRSVV